MMQERIGVDFNDFLRTIMGDDEKARNNAIRADTQIRRQSVADHTLEAKRKRQHSHDRRVLRDTALPRGGRYGAYRRKMTSAARCGRGGQSFSVLLPQHSILKTDACCGLLSTEY